MKVIFVLVLRIKPKPSHVLVNVLPPAWKSFLKLIFCTFHMLQDAQFELTDLVHQEKLTYTNLSWDLDLP
jgi:hypothetical protein